VAVQPLGTLFRVRLGPFPDVTSAERVAARLQELGFERPFVVKE
jgi:cell division protein FtsN